MARRRHRRRPWYRTRAYRLTRTVVLTAALVTGAVRCTQGGDPAGTEAGRAARSDAGAGQDGRAGAGPDAPSGSTPATSGSHGIAADPRPAHPRRQPPPPHPLPRSRPTRVLVPYIGVDAPVIPLGLDRDHRLTAPPEGDADQVGWYERGPSPGEQGTTVLVGHLDTDSGPAVFAGLHELGPGHLVEVRRADGRTAVYTVDAVRTYEKAHFPNREVYGARSRPELRLITCGGAYHRRTGYAGNTVVFAYLTRTK
ncbi:class F sortase [Streptomyces sp. NPDC047081]|uniref:class F sortase n=1 Tax=Streptomyces sp. NPDC047081 TaxID=3154706 RepID=UPI0033FA00A3